MRSLWIFTLSCSLSLLLLPSLSQANTSPEGFYYRLFISGVVHDSYTLTGVCSSAGLYNFSGICRTNPDGSGAGFTPSLRECPDPVNFPNSFCNTQPRPVDCPSSGTPVEGEPISGCATQLNWQPTPCYWDNSLTCASDGTFVYTGQPSTENDDPFTNPNDSNLQQCFDSNGNYAGTISSSLTCPSNLPPINECQNCFGGGGDTGGGDTGGGDTGGGDTGGGDTGGGDTGGGSTGGGSTGGGSTGGGSGSGDGDGEGDSEGETPECDPSTEFCGFQFQSSSFDVCSVPFTCDGDAFECHISYTQHKKYCQFYIPEGVDIDPENALQVLEEQYGFPILADGETLADAITDEIDVTETFFSSIGNQLTNPSGREGSCPAPITINVLGVTKQFDWSFICDMALEARPLVLLATMIMCFFMFASSIFGITLRGK